ncbi:Stk1 family PASTA domain-containing Ser/Thr kinase [Actinoplanes palleronii]|uniref:PASTA domain-containing protein n=1 Tax=Actinoplanes palleronii TaxID=113570 RepID=A0ABQ4B7N7_9ACTN|nr:Stk1 family PASTA domain-containing Ser/Thr kinase [Actinoplanes palleronii]GIE66648.1 hypothetical protein Apa02nite_027560 [Actinoplanes palleronii]
MPDERQPGRDGQEPRPDETRPMPAVDDTVADVPQASRNQPSGGPRSGDTSAAETRPMAAAGDWDPDPRGADDSAWTGRAAVRAPRPEQAAASGGDWATIAPEEEPPGRWWMPIVFGIVGLTLVALLAYGIYVIVQNSGAEVDTPQPTPAQTTTTTAQTAETTPPTTEPPVSTVPTTEPTSTEAAVPALRGMPLADAKAALDRTGLGYRVIYRVSDAEPGTVIDSDPVEGQLVPPDTRITLVVAAEQTGDPASTTTAPAGGASAGPGED